MTAATLLFYNLVTLQYTVPGNEASDVHWLESDAEFQARVFLVAATKKKH